MSLDAMIILAGVIVAVLPFLGFPSSWNHAILFILGLFIVVLGIVVHRRYFRKTMMKQNSFGEMAELQEQDQ